MTEVDGGLQSETLTVQADVFFDAIRLTTARSSYTVAQLTVNDDFTLKVMGWWNLP